MKSDDSRSEDAEENDSQMTRGDKLGEDELALIFSNTWLSAQDLLNLRLVSRRWRDAATTTLRQRDACVVELWARWDSSDELSVYKKKSKYTDENKLSQLTDLISMSPKFPATDFHIHMFLTHFASYTLFPDLLNFFKLHGDKIKTLGHHGYFTPRCLLDILQVYAPALESLDLSEAKNFGSVKEDESEENDLKWTSKSPVPIKSFTFGSFEYYSQQYEHELFRLLLSPAPSKLSSIENVTLDSLQMVLTEGKGHLIRSFKYDGGNAHLVPASQLTTFISLNPKPKLTKVTLDLRGQCPTASATIVNSLNEFIEFFKDTVQTLNLSCYYYQRPWDPLLNIPPMKNLKSFTLKLGCGCGGHYIVGDNHLCQAAGESKIFVDIKRTFFQFQDGISAQNYFPSLKQVHLHSWLSKFNEVSPVSFFSFGSNTTNDADGSPAAAQLEFLPKVDILEINRNRTDVCSRPSRPSVISCHSPTEAELLAQVFPNIRILKLKCGQVSNLSSSFWTMSPNVEFMEIYDITSCSKRRRRRDVEMSRFVDRIFTGFSDQMLRSSRNPFKADNLENSKFDPRISDLQSLRELKLKFLGKWSTKFATSVTGVHAFSKMENTKFIISYDHDPKEYGGEDGWNQISGDIDAADDIEESGNDAIAKYEELIFGPLKPYVYIVH